MERWGQCKVKRAPDELGRGYYSIDIYSAHILEAKLKPGEPGFKRWRWIRLISEAFDGPLKCARVILDLGVLFLSPFRLIVADYFKHVAILWPDA